MNERPLQRTTLQTRSAFIADVHPAFKGSLTQYLPDSSPVPIPLPA